MVGGPLGGGHGFGGGGDILGGCLVRSLVGGEGLLSGMELLFGLGVGEWVPRCSWMRGVG